MDTNKAHVPTGYRIVELSHEQFQKYMREWGAKIFSDNDTSMDIEKVISESEMSGLDGLRKNLAGLYRLRLGIYQGDEFCGWFVGEQYNAETFYMRNSAILPNYRRKGLYTALMREVLIKVKEAGFQVVLSRHTNTNNSIIIPKLKEGFVVTAMELSDRFGTMVHLSYFFNQNRSRILEFRAGDLKPDEAIKSALGFK